MAIPDGYPCGNSIGAPPQYGVQVLDRAVTQKIAPDSVSPIDLYIFTVPGGILGTDSRLRLQLTGIYRAAPIAPITLAWTVYWGGGTHPLFPLCVIPIGASAWNFKMEAILTARNSENSQELYAKLFSVLQGGPSGTNFASEDASWPAEPSDNPLMLRVTTQWSALPGTYPSVEMNTAFLELLD